MKKLAAILTGAVLMMGMAVSAQATTLTLSDGTTTKLVIDGTGVDTLNTHYDGILDGVVIFIGTIGNWNLNVSTGFINPSKGIPSMHLNSIDNTLTSIDDSTLMISFESLITSAWAGNGANVVAGGTLLAGTGNSIGFTTDINGTTYNTMNFASPDTAFSGKDIFSYNPTGNDTVTMMAIITHDNAGTSSFDYDISPVPEPGTMVLLGAGLLGLAIAGKRRMNKEA